MGGCRYERCAVIEKEGVRRVGGLVGASPAYGQGASGVGDGSVGDLGDVRQSDVVVDVGVSDAGAVPCAGSDGAEAGCAGYVERGGGRSGAHDVRGEEVG